MGNEMDDGTDKKLVNLTYKLPLLCPELDINDSYCIISLSQVTFGHLFCIGDQIVYINGISPNSRKEALRAMQKRGVDITVTVLRQSNIGAVSLERIKKIGLKRRKGCHYFIATLELTHVKQSLGMYVRKVGDRVFVSKVSPNGLAANIIRPGDAIIDVDEKKVISEVFLKKTLIEKLISTKKCEVLVERADYGKISKRPTLSLLSKVSTDSKNNGNDPMMPKDAAEIGIRQSQYFHEHCRSTSIFPIASRAILKSSSRRSVISTVSSNKSSSQKDRIIIRPNLTSEVRMRMKTMDTQTSEAPPSHQSSEKQLPPKNVQFKPIIDSVMVIPSDYSTRSLRKVQSSRGSSSFLSRLNLKR